VLESMLVDYEYFLPFQDVAEYFWDFILSHGFHL
jgi:hypothetical protein